MLALRYTKALADETRLRILHLIGRFELSVGELVSALGMAQPRVSRHLGILAEAGLVSVRRDGQWAFYRAVEQGPAGRFLDCLGTLLADEAGLDDDVSQARAVLARRTQETRQFFDVNAPNWERMRREILGDLDLAAAVAERLGSCGSVADLGCGTGEVMRAVATRSERVIGVDNAQAMLDIAARRFEDLPGVSWRIGDLSHLPLSDAEVDCAVMSLTLHHLPAPAAALTEARRVLRPGGRIVIAELERHGREEMRSRYGDRWLGFAAEEVLDFLDAAGFREAAVEPLDLSTGLVLNFFAAVRPGGPRPA